VGNNYFSSKEDALLSVGADRGAQMVAALRARPEGEPLASLLHHCGRGRPTGGGLGHVDGCPREPSAGEAG